MTRWEEADVTYKVDGIYNKAGEGGVIYNDPDLGISWPIANPIVSDKDKVLPRFREIF